MALHWSGRAAFCPSEVLRVCLIDQIETIAVKNREKEKIFWKVSSTHCYWFIRVPDYFEKETGLVFHLHFETGLWNTKDEDKQKTILNSPWLFKSPPMRQRDWQRETLDHRSPALLSVLTNGPKGLVQCDRPPSLQGDQPPSLQGGRPPSLQGDRPPSL